MWHLVCISHSPQLVHREAWAMKWFPSLSRQWMVIWVRRRGENRQGQSTSARSHTFPASRFYVLCLWSKSFPTGCPFLPVSLSAPAMCQRERSPLITTSSGESEARHRRKEERPLNPPHSYVSCNKCTKRKRTWLLRGYFMLLFKDSWACFVLIRILFTYLYFKMSLLEKSIASLNVFISLILETLLQTQGTPVPASSLVKWG